MATPSNGEKSTATDGPPAYATPEAYANIGIPLSSIPTTASYAVPPSDHSAPPGYPTALPATFPVGNGDTPPLVSLGEVEAHIRIIAAFHKRRVDVLACPAWDGLGLSDDAKWGTYVARAAYRFDAWYEGVISRDGRPEGLLGEREIPPLDVGMIWHSYCLNPRIYLEDTLSRLAPLLHAGPFPLSRLSAALDPSSLLPLDPHPETQALFEHLTDLPWDAGLSVTGTERAKTSCPQCATLVNVPWLAPSEEGYAQPAFTATCPSCALKFNRESLGVRRLCNDLEKWIQEPGNNFSAGTLLDPVTGMPNYEKSLAYNKRLFNWFSAVCKSKPATWIGQQVGWNMLKVELCCRTGMSMLSQVPTPPRVRRVFSMYRHPGVASVDLVGATLRQGTFIRALYSLGWLTPARFAADPTPLLRAIARFHAWLDLLSLHPAAFLVPTLDIDLAWHTLMLSPGRYRRDVFGLVGRVVEHEDKVEEGVLGEGFDATGRLWKARFGVPYSYCGCPPSTASKLVDRTSLSNIRATLLPLRGRSDSAASARSTASLPGANAPGSASGVPRPTRADLAPDEKDAPLSHASEHNSILVISHSQCAKARQEREMDIAKRGEALRRAAAKGKGDEWEEGIARRSLGHEPAFLLPLPPAGPGVQNDSALFYLPWIIDGTSLAGGKCAAGLQGGMCVAGGGKGFCGNLGANAWGGKIANSMNNA